MFLPADPQIDQNLIAQHLRLLNYKKGERIFLRAFYPSSDQRKTGDKGRKSVATDISAIAKTAADWQRDGMGVYLVVNGQGQKDEEVKTCRAIFYEHDNLSKEIQINLWRSLELPKPTFQVDTGGKSIHSYWMLAEPILAADWRILQTDLLEFADADRSLKNPSRVMRLAGCYHFSQNLSKIVSAAGEKYSYEQLRAIIPSPKIPMQEKPLLFNDLVPLSACLSHSDRALLQFGSQEGGRNTNGAKLARNLIGTGSRLEYLGIQYTETPVQLFADYCNKCNPPLDTLETETIWNSAKKDNPTPSLTDDALLNCVKATKQQLTLVYKSRSAASTIGNVANRLLATQSGDNKIPFTHDIQSIVTSVNAILGDNAFLSEQSNVLDQLYIDLTAKGRLDRKVFDRIIAQCQLKSSSLESVERDRLASLLDASSAKIDWASVLPPALARDLVHDAAVQNIDPIVLWQPLLSTVASLIGVKVNLDVESHTIPALVWTATVLETGGGKTRADKLILSPLRELQHKEMERYSEAVRDYKREYSKWEKEKGDRKTDEPTQPSLRKYLFEVATIQAVARRCAENNDNGALWARDELVGLFNSLGQFKSGAADESLQILLSAWNGGGFCCDRVNKSDSFFSKASALSITGGIQPPVFRSIFQDAADSNGLQARFLFAVPKKLPQQRVKGYCRLSDRLPLLYDWLLNVPKTTVKLSPQADNLYTQIVNLAELESEKTANPAVKAWLAKWATQTMRIALILHFIECFYDSNEINTTLTKETLQRALTIADYYRTSFEFLQEKVNVSDSISTLLLQLIDRARESLSGISLRDAYRAMRRSIEPLAKEAKVDIPTFTEQLFLKAEALCYASVVRIGRSLRLVTNVAKSATGIISVESFASDTGSLSTPTIDKNIVANDDKLPDSLPDKHINCQQHYVNTSTGNVANSPDQLESQITELLQTPDSLSPCPPVPLQSSPSGELAITPEKSNFVQSDKLPKQEPLVELPLNGAFDSSSEKIELSPGTGLPVSICEYENSGLDIVAAFVSHCAEVVVLSLSGKRCYSGSLVGYDVKNGVCKILDADSERFAIAQQTYLI